MNLSIRRAAVDDIPLIAALAEKIWRIHYPPIIGDEQVEYMLQLMYSSSGIREQMEQGQQFFLLQKHHHPVGYLAVSEKEQGHYFLHKFYILNEEQGKGLGKRFFQEIIQNFCPGIHDIRLTVNRKNYKSINFYFRLGFVIEEVKDFDIGNGYFMEDFVMVKKV